MDKFLQKYKEDYGLTDACGFTQIINAIFSGQIATLDIDIGAEPLEDKEIEENNRLLSEIDYISELSETSEVINEKIFHGKFWGGLADSDGFIEWVKPIRMSKWSLNDTGEQIEEYVEVQSMRAPLEVGYTSVFHTIAHIGGSLALARWPYGSTRISIFVALDKNIWRKPLTANL